MKTSPKISPLEATEILKSKKFVRFSDFKFKMNDDPFGCRCVIAERFEDGEIFFPSGEFNSELTAETVWVA
jgi:hypothetical protein